MATSTKATPTTEISDLAQRIREQLVTSVQQGQQQAVNAAKTWVKTVSVLPVPDLPKVPGIPALPSVEATTRDAFDLVVELLNAQRDFALELTSVFVPEKSA